MPFLPEGIRAQAAGDPEAKGVPQRVPLLGPDTGCRAAGRDKG